MKLLFKAHIKAYQRTSQSGQTVMVKEHDDKRLAARPKSKHPRRRAFATPAHPAAPHHELTREEFHAHARKQPGGLDRSPASIDQEHKRHIRQALKDGKQVPAFVTSDYAEFRSDKQQPQAKQPPQPGEKPPSNDDQTWFNEEDDDIYDFEKPVDKSQVRESSETNANDEFSWFNDDEDEGQAPPSFKPSPHPTSEEETAAWLESVMQEPDIVKAIKANQTGTPTDQIHKRADGSYTPERSQIHEAIIASMLNPKAQAKDGQKPHAVILMGCPGAGKTSTLAPMTKEFGVDFTTINADDVKAKLPEYTGANAGLVHEESSDVAEGMLFPRALQARHNLVMDITGSNGEKVKKMVEHFHNQGYEISIAYAHLPAWKAATRVVDRFRKEGRFVPPTYVVKKVDGNPERTYNELKDDPRVSHWRKYNNDVAKGTQAPLQEQGQRDNPDASRPGLQKAALNRRTFRSDGRKPERSDSPSLQATLRKASRLHANLTKALVYLDDDLTSPDLDPTSRGVLRAERYRLLSQLEALQQKMDEVTHA